MTGLTVVKRPAYPVVRYAEDPIVRVVRDCVYVPLTAGNFWENKTWGVYASDGKLVEEAAFRSAPNMELTGQNETCLLDVSDTPYAPQGRYFYIGNINPHYGHFILGTMARLWALPSHGGSSLPLIGHAVGDPRHWFTAHAVPRILFGAAGIVMEDFANFQTPVRIRELVVAAPSFVEMNHAHTVHATAAHRWGDRLVKTQDLSGGYDAIYLARTRLAHKRDDIANEAQILEGLASLGVTIVYPEELSIPQQIALFRKARLVIGQCGSAFHTTFFSPPSEKQKFINIVPSPDVYSYNHALMDAVNENPSSYIFLDGHWSQRSGGGKDFIVDDPLAAAKEIIEYSRSL